MKFKITGEFSVKMAPQPQEGGDAAPGRMLLDKRYDGPLAGAGVGQMLAIRTATPGSAGYVAIEIVNGTLDGLAGSFALQHSSTMSRGVPSQSITVVPDSGTGELLGLVGRMSIRIESGKHFYDFEYEMDTASGIS